MIKCFTIKATSNALFGMILVKKKMRMIKCFKSPSQDCFCTAINASLHFGVMGDLSALFLFIV